MTYRGLEGRAAAADAVNPLVDGWMVWVWKDRVPTPLSYVRCVLCTPFYHALLPLALVLCCAVICCAVLCCAAPGACSFESEISSKNQEQASLTRQRLQLEKEQKKLQRQQEKKVRCRCCCFNWALCSTVQGGVPIPFFFSALLTGRC